MVQNKDLSISAIRCIAMCMIITCHMLQYYNNVLAWWFNVGVQIFFIVSGYLYSHKEILDPIKWIGKQFKKILIPYYVFIIITYLIYTFIGHKINLADFIKSLFCINTLDGLAHLWFIKYILFCYLITPYLYRLRLWIKKQSLIKGFICLSIILVTYNIVSSPIYSFINPIWISCYIIGFFYGVYSRTLKKQFLTLSNSILVGSSVIINITKIYFLYFNQNNKIISSFVFTLFCNVSHLMLGLLLLIILRYIFKNIKTNTILSFSDKYSYEIYIVHHLFILSPITLMGITPFMGLNWLIVIFVTLISAVVLKATAKKLI